MDLEALSKRVFTFFSLCLHDWRENFIRIPDFYGVLIIHDDENYPPSMFFLFFSRPLRENFYGPINEKWFANRFPNFFYCCLCAVNTRLIGFVWGTQIREIILIPQMEVFEILRRSICQMTSLSLWKFTKFSWRTRKIEFQIVFSILNRSNNVLPNRETQRLLLRVRILLSRVTLRISSLANSSPRYYHEKVTYLTYFQIRFPLFREPRICRDTSRTTITSHHCKNNYHNNNNNKESLQRNLSRSQDPSCSAPSFNSRLQSFRLFIWLPRQPSSRVCVCISNEKLEKERNVKLLWGGWKNAFRIKLRGQWNQSFFGSTLHKYSRFCNCKCYGFVRNFDNVIKRDRYGGHPMMSQDERQDPSSEPR